MGLSAWAARVATACFIVGNGGSAFSQTPAIQGGAPRSENLVELEGRYEYRDGLTLFMVAQGHSSLRSSTVPNMCYVLPVTTHF